MRFTAKIFDLKKDTKHHFLKKLVIGLAFFSATVLCAQKDAPLQKKETTFKGVYDYANLLAPQEEQRLAKKLINYSDTTSTQIAIATITSLNGRDISILATEKAHDWGIGQKGKDNGVFILIAQKERKIKIATGYGVEHLLTDYKSKEIIDYIITPSFKKQQYYQGLNQATHIIIEILDGTYKADPKKQRSSGKGSFLFIIVIFIILFIIFRKNDNSGGGNHRGNRRIKRGSGDILTSILLSSLGRSSGGSFGGSSGGGSFGGGGFGGGFGGGGFGGGGASGGW